MEKYNYCCKISIFYYSFVAWWLSIRGSYIAIPMRPEVSVLRALEENYLCTKRTRNDELHIDKFFICQKYIHFLSSECTPTTNIIDFNFLFNVYKRKKCQFQCQQKKNVSLIHNIAAPFYSTNSIDTL